MGLAIFQTFAGIPARKFCEGQIKQGRVKGGMKHFSNAPWWVVHLILKLRGITHGCCSGWVKPQAARQSLTNRGKTIEKQQEIAKILGGHWLDDPGRLRFKTTRGKKSSFSPVSPKPRQTALWYIVSANKLNCIKQIFDSVICFSFRRRQLAVFEYWLPAWAARVHAGQRQGAQGMLFNTSWVQPISLTFP